VRYYLANNFVLKRLETPALYDIRGDELYELDETAFEFLKKCARTEGCSGEEADKAFTGYCLSEGILSGAPAAAGPLAESEQDHKKAQAFPEASFPGSSLVPSLRYLELQITTRCNLRCRHCFIDHQDQNELSADVIKDILDEFESMQGLRLMITGGEPATHSDFGVINELLPGYGFRKILFTNGLLLEKELINKLNVDEIQFSVDGMERGHDALRGRGTYKKVMRSIRDALSSSITVSIATMVHSENTGEFAAMETLFKSMDIKDWTVDVPSLTSHIKNDELLHLPPEIAGQFLNYGFGGGLHGGGEGYACGLHLLSVLANGLVAKCAFYIHSPLGNVSEGLQKCRSRLKPVRLDALQCAGIACPFIDTCRGGCRFRASTAQGEWGTNSRDIYKCCAYGII
jgi:radical SAM protein with 4Fe4S-binding SPASM domain